MYMVNKNPKKLRFFWMLKKTGFDANKIDPPMLIVEAWGRTQITHCKF